MSLGYTPIVTTNLSDVALVQHAPWGGDGGAEEADYLEQCADYWLSHPSGLPFVPDVLWFNSGMHNIVANGTPGHGTVPGQGGNSSAESYAQPLSRVTAKLVAWAKTNNVKLIFALTTPFLNNLVTDTLITGTLNVAATQIMNAANVPIVDLHTPIIKKCGPVPQASCFNLTGCWSPHCPPGYEWLAMNYIIPVLRAALKA